MNCIEALLYWFNSLGASDIHFVPGGMIVWLIDAAKTQGYSLHNYHHEQSAGFAAESASRFSSLQLVAATSGPGATNLVTSVASSFFDSACVIYLTGQVNTRELSALGQRQKGFQETDISSILKPITLHSKTYHNVDALIQDLPVIANHVTSTRPGPIHIDLPLDVQRTKLTIDQQKGFEDWPYSNINTSRDHIVLDNEAYLLESLRKAFAEKKRPLLLLGHGAVSRATEITKIVYLLRSIGIPYVTSLRAVGLLSTSDLNYGMIGTYGLRSANLILKSSDLLICVGTRLDVRQTGANIQDFSSNKAIIHVSNDQTDLDNSTVTSHLSLNMEAKDFLGLLSRTYLTSDISARTAYADHIRKAYPHSHEYLPNEINPVEPLRHLFESARKDITVCTDVGQHQMWTAQAISQMHSHTSKIHLLTSAGHGAMGWGLPAAIGASRNRDELTILITGDGSFQMNIQELQTLYREQLGILIVVFNNYSHGMVAKFQDEVVSGRKLGTVDGYSSPSFSSVAISYNLRSERLNYDEFKDWCCNQTVDNMELPFILEVSIPVETSDVRPKREFGTNLMWLDKKNVLPSISN